MSDGNGTSLVPAFKSFLERLEPSIAKVASSYIKPDRITALLLGEAAKTPLLYQTMETQAGRNSVALFFQLSEQLGLEPGSALGLIYATPRKNKNREWTILPVIGYKGMCELARRSGEIKRINAKPFYADELKRGLIIVSEEPPDVQHKWDPDVTKTDDTLVGAYAVVETKDGGKATLVMNRSEIISRGKRGGSFDRDISPWKSDFPAMCRKTVLKALLSGGTVPLSAEARQALIADDPTDDVDLPGAVTAATRQIEAEVPEEASRQAKAKSGHGNLRAAMGLDPQEQEQSEGEEPNPFDQ